MLMPDGADFQLRARLCGLAGGDDRSSTLLAVPSCHLSPVTRHS